MESIRKLVPNVTEWKCLVRHSMVSELSKSSCLQVHLKYFKRLKLCLQRLEYLTGHSSREINFEIQFQKEHFLMKLK